MSKFSRVRVSPALAISIVALVLAAAGTSFAQAPVAFVARTLGLNRKQTKQVKAIADKEIKVKAPKLSVLFAKSAGSATSAGSAATAGTASSATTAGSATNATNATNAGNANTVGGQTVQKFFFTSPTVTTTLKTVAQFATFTLQARCNGGFPDLELTSSENDWDLGGTFIDPTNTPHSLYGFNLPAGVNRELVPGALVNGGYAVGTTPSGHTVSINYQVDSNATLGTNACDAAGVMIGS